VNARVTQRPVVVSPSRQRRPIVHGTPSGGVLRVTTPVPRSLGNRMIESARPEFGQTPTRRELTGVGLVMAGIALPGGALCARFCSSGSKHHCGVPKLPRQFQSGLAVPEIHRLPRIGAWAE